MVDAMGKYNADFDADMWLEQGGAVDGERVKIAGQGFSVVSLPFARF